MIFMRIFLCLLILSIGIAGEIWAHGLGGVGVGVLVSDGVMGQLEVVRLTTGLAIRRGTGWEFVCEARWGGLRNRRWRWVVGGSRCGWRDWMGCMWWGRGPGGVSGGSGKVTAGEVRGLMGERRGPRGVALTLAATGSGLWRLDEGKARGSHGGYASFLA